MGIFLLLFALVALILVPHALIWALNVLLSMDISHSFEHWFAALVIICIFREIVTYTKR